MTVNVVTTSVEGFEAIVLENDFVRAVILPALGGRVWELEDRVRRRQWIWHRDDVALASSPVGSVYDDVWAGGWEELFPNDAPGIFEGRDLPDHGEWWATSWLPDARSDDGDAVLTLSARMSILKADCVKEFRLSPEGTTLSVRYEIHNREEVPVHFLFKQHLPVEITPRCRLALPGGQARVVDPAFGTIVGGRDPFEWPIARDEADALDMRRIPPRQEARDFLYVDSLPESWCGVDDLEREASIRLAFEGEKLPFVWLFLTYGGWRNLYTAVLEPCTNMPKDLAEARRLGQSAYLEPGREFVTTVSATVAGLSERIK